MPKPCCNNQIFIIRINFSNWIIYRLKLISAVSGAFKCHFSVNLRKSKFEFKRETKKSGSGVVLFPFSVISFFLIHVNHLIEFKKKIIDCKACLRQTTLFLAFHIALEKYFD